MSRPEFLADHDLNEAILSGLRLREPAVLFTHVRDWSLQEKPDDEILAFASEAGFIVASHDRRTMSEAAYRRLREGLSLRVDSRQSANASRKGH